MWVAPHVSSCITVSFHVEEQGNIVKLMTFTVSVHIAPIVAVIDKGFNGYRDLILPMSESDKLVRMIIVTTSAQHLSISLGGVLVPHRDAKSNILQELRQRAEDNVLDRDAGSVTALLLLLVCEIVTGGTDFNLISSSLQALLRATESSSPCPDNQLLGFVKIQIFR